jgi:hypothetical protein
MLPKIMGVVNYLKLLIMIIIKESGDGENGEKVL